MRSKLRPSLEVLAQMALWVDSNIMKAGTEFLSTRLRDIVQEAKIYDDYLFIILELEQYNWTSYDAEEGATKTAQSLTQINELAKFLSAKPTDKYRRANLKILMGKALTHIEEDMSLLKEALGSFGYI